MLPLWNTYFSRENISLFSEMPLLLWRRHPRLYIHRRVNALCPTASFTVRTLCSCTLMNDLLVPAKTSQKHRKSLGSILGGSNKLQGCSNRCCRDCALLFILDSAWSTSYCLLSYNAKWCVKEWMESERRYVLSG